MAEIVELQVKLLEEQVAELQQQQVETNEKFEALLLSHVTNITKLSVTVAIMNKVLKAVAANMMSVEEEAPVAWNEYFFTPGDNDG